MAQVEKYIPDADIAETGMTLWQIIVSGGEIMVVITLLSLLALALIVYYFLTVKHDKLLPPAIMGKIMPLIESKKYHEARVLCENNPSLISSVALTGLSRREYGKAVMEEAMEEKGKRDIDSLWRKLSYLADIAAIAPMVGLLGTVLGMIQAFNVIAFQTGGVKPILLASGISKAMVTTAAGLIVAIPSMVFYSYFRGKIETVISSFEHISSELLNMLIKGAE